MPRRRRFCPVGIPVHVVQRGHNRHLCFTCDSDIAAYAHFLEEGATRFDVHIHGWVFMTNHIHLLITPGKENAVSRLMQHIGRLYVGRFNYTYARSGALFEGRFKSSLVQDEEYLIACLRYIELNPVRAGMVKDPGDYRWSSYSAHGFGLVPGMWTPHPLYLGLGESAVTRQANYRELIAQSLEIDVITKIRHCANKGLILGTEKFKSQFENITGDKPG